MVTKLKRGDDTGGSLEFGWAASLADDGTFNLPVIPNAGRGTVVVGADEEAADFTIKSDGTFSLISASANIVANEELLTLDVAPGGAGWAAGNTITGQTSSKTCVIVTVLTTTTYVIRSRTGAFTLGEILSNGTDTADQGAAHPQVTQPGTDGKFNLGCGVTSPAVIMNRLNAAKNAVMHLIYG